ncbi:MULTISPECIES: endonuclease NucS domain-containing protein [unclassified Coleofasciculus]|uniref:endonuclease NucS domain-containing protein n=1 Tax=unclassified Coleofasciculus TaxID=2692782 RepID=UPI0018805D10|nr:MULTISPECIES: endonuclease NucS domain-containing protein [unclassified Coleofasciculus]MBE9126676.1 DUF91 domain-containing protein [Coleofasciculus sp. LEGE 07081]MBE9150770.1 DUF91 domain-containing protein [Coleofasciculus sp. LEGE 07092]
MLNLVNLRKTGIGWNFESEANLEDFVWSNLQQWLGLTPLKQQYSVKGLFCDILAVTEQKQLVVLELKNTEDRYIVQQLTRYYHALLEEKPFQDQVNYDQPIKLVAIAPSFHQDNITDIKYHTLPFQFLQFSLIQKDEKLYFQSQDLNSLEFMPLIEVTPSVSDNTANIPAPPKALINLLNKGNSETKELLLTVRQKILRFDNRIKENSDSGVIRYRVKGKPCAEIRFVKWCNQRGIFLWLPIPNSKEISQKRIGRMYIQMNRQSTPYIMHTPPGKKTSKNSWFMDRYMSLIGKNNDLNSLESLVDIALGNWLERLKS